MTSYISKLPHDIICIEEFSGAQGRGWGMFFCPRLRMVFLSGEWSSQKDRIEAVTYHSFYEHRVLSNRNCFSEAKSGLRKWIKEQAREILSRKPEYQRSQVRCLAR